MGVTSSVSESIAFAPASCCQPINTRPDYLKKIDLVCRIALGAIATIISPSLFAISMGAGLALGVGYAALRYCQQKPLFPAGESKPVCAQGYMDFLSGMRFPPEIGSVATTAFIAAHMRHDPQFFVPFCGLFIGFWLGREMVTAARDLSNYAFKPVTICCAAT